MCDTLRVAVTKRERAKIVRAAIFAQGGNKRRLAAEIAARLGIDGPRAAENERRRLYNLENGSTVEEPARRDAIAAVLNIDPDVLLAAPNSGDEDASDSLEDQLAELRRRIERLEAERR